MVDHNVLLVLLELVLDGGGSVRDPLQVAFHTVAIARRWQRFLPQLC